MTTIHEMLSPTERKDGAISGTAEEIIAYWSGTTSENMTTTARTANTRPLDTPSSRPVSTEDGSDSGSGGFADTSTVADIPVLSVLCRDTHRTRVTTATRPGLYGIFGGKAPPGLDGV